MTKPGAPEESPPRYAVIIVTYGRDEAVQRTLRAVMAQSVGRRAMEVCVVNNGGSDLARARWKDQVDVWVDAKENLGCSGGRNLGVQSTHAPLVVFVDDDGLPAPDFVAALGEVMAREPDAISVRGRATALDHPIFTAMAPHYHRGPEEAPDMLTLEGACVIRRSDFEAAGGYDVTRAYGEGLELSGRLFRVRPEGKMLYTPHAVLQHDYVQGLGHFLHKAKMMAAARERMQSEDDPIMAEARARHDALRFVDGRQRWERVAGYVVKRGLNMAMRWYRLEGRVKRLLGR